MLILITIFFNFANYINIPINIINILYYTNLQGLIGIYRICSYAMHHCAAISAKSRAARTVILHAAAIVLQEQLVLVVEAYLQERATQDQTDRTSTHLWYLWCHSQLQKASPRDAKRLDQSGAFRPRISCRLAEPPAVQFRSLMLLFGIWTPCHHMSSGRNRASCCLITLFLRCPYMADAEHAEWSSH